MTLDKEPILSKRFKIITLGITLLLVIVFGFTVVIALSHYKSYDAKRQRLITGFVNVKVGDTKQTVVQILGAPDEVENPHTSSSNVDLDRKEVYWYISILDRWGVAFDRDGKVIDKGYNVSF